MISRLRKHAAFKSIAGIVSLLVVFSVIVSIIGFNAMTDALLEQYSDGAFLTAITAAETGHLVFGTLHTGSASDAVDRIVQVFPEGMQTQIRLQLSMCLNAVLTQQLIPKKGGGRALAVEFMLVTDAIRNLIRSGNTPQIANAIATSVSIGGQTMDQALIKLVRSGTVSRDVALHYAHNVDFVKKNAV